MKRIICITNIYNRVSYINFDVDEIYNVEIFDLESEGPANHRISHNGRFKRWLRKEEFDALFRYELEYKLTTILDLI